MNELFPIPESPVPPLEAARRKLALAIEAEAKATKEYEEADEYGMSRQEYQELEDDADLAESERIHAEAELARLEQIEIRAR